MTFALPDVWSFVCLYICRHVYLGLVGGSHLDDWKQDSPAAIATRFLSNEQWWPCHWVSVFKTVNHVLSTVSPQATNPWSRLHSVFKDVEHAIEKGSVCKQLVFEIWKQRGIWRIWLWLEQTYMPLRLELKDFPSKGLGDWRRSFRHLATYHTLAWQQR